MEKRHRRPLTVTLTLYGVFLLGGGYLLQSGQALSRYAFYSGLPLPVPAWYLPLAGAFWGVLWLVLGAGLWRRKEWARRFTLIAIPLQLGAWLADWLLLSRSEIAIQSFGFDLTVRLAAGGLAAVGLLLDGRRSTAADAGSAAQESGRESKQPHVE
jgi:hypothetical protein